MKKKKSSEYDWRNWRQKTIEILEKRDYGDPNDAPTGMIKRCLELRLVPLDEFTIDDIRLMIGQAFVLSYLVPLALEHLRSDVFVEGLYPGDLLATVLKIDQNFWLENKALWMEVFELIDAKRAELEKHRINTTAFDSVF
jgi:contact-dependent growth inhibition (CDI) system CdiI-like immunity protein